MLIALNSFINHALLAISGAELNFAYYRERIACGSVNSADDIVRGTQSKLKQLRELLKMMKNVNNNEVTVDVVDYPELTCSIELLCDTVITITKGAILSSAGAATLLPPRSCFVWGDVRKGLRLMAEKKSMKKAHSIIVADPPWPNRSVRRAGRYQTMRLEDLLTLGANLRCLASNDAILALWVTNDPKVISFAKNELFSSWGFRYVQTWYWLKVGPEGRPVCDVSLHRMPMERVLIGVRTTFDGISAIEDPIKIEKAEDLVNFQFVDCSRDAVVESLYPSSESRGSTVSFPVHCFASVPLRHSWKPDLASMLVQARRWMLDRCGSVRTTTSPPPPISADASGGGGGHGIIDEEGGTGLKGEPPTAPDFTGSSEARLRFLELFAR
jgi:hypothetical protein